MTIPKWMLDEAFTPTEHIMKASEQLAEDLREYKRLWLTGEYEFPALVERAMELPRQREQAVYYALLNSHAESTDWREKITKRLDVAIQNAGTKE